MPLHLVPVVCAGTSNALSAAVDRFALRRTTALAGPFFPKKYLSLNQIFFSTSHVHAHRSRFFSA